MRLTARSWLCLSHSSWRYRRSRSLSGCCLQSYEAAKTWPTPCGHQKNIEASHIFWFMLGVALGVQLREASGFNLLHDRTPRSQHINFIDFRRWTSAQASFMFWVEISSSQHDGSRATCVFKRKGKRVVVRVTAPSQAENPMDPGDASVDPKNSVFIALTQTVFRKNL